MSFLIDPQELKPGLIIFRRADVKHRNWYCRVKLPKADRYKVVSLKTPDIGTARERAFDHDADIRFRIKHDVPIFNRPFSQIAEEYLKAQKERAETGIITEVRAENIESAIRTLDRYVGSTQIHLVGQDKWESYPTWRRRQKRQLKPAGHVENKLKVKFESTEGVRQTQKDENPRRFSDWTIRAEMTVFRAIMAYAASKKYIPQNHIFKGNLPTANERREEFTREEYRRLHTFARGWVKEAKKPASKWYREITYNFMLIMCNTGMRPPEAKNLRWRDVAITKDKEGRELVVLNVRGKKKYRRLVAAGNVAEYLERVRAIAKATGPDDPVFTTHNGKPATTLYASLIKDLLKESKLLIGPAGTPRSTYCFRHTYATLRLSEGVDVYFLAEQMGTSVQIIEKHYGHINPVKNADRILQGMHVWESAPEGASETVAKHDAGTARVKKGAAAKVAKVKHNAKGSKTHH